MSDDVKIGFKLQKIQVPLVDLLPLRPIKDPSLIRRYKTIFVSIKEVGLIEPLMVFPQPEGKYLILDGHIRWHVLRELGQTEADCIVACDDECFTYNARVSRITPIQEHRMIVKAVNQGVKPERIAAALNIPVRVVKAFMNLLEGINAEVADLLKDKNISPRNLKLLRRVNEVRQLEIAELMVDADNYSSAYVEAMILGTPPDQLTKVAPVKKRKKGFSPENIARLESEMAMLERDFKAMEAGYGQNVLHLTLASAYIRKLLENINVVAALKAGHAEILAEFQKISALEAL